MIILPKTYLSEVLSTDNFGIPIEANFAIGIDNVFTIIQNINAQLNTITKNKYFRTGMYSRIREGGIINKDDLIFATGVTLPGETVDGARVGASTTGGIHGGLLSAPILKGRKDLANFEMALIETNESFIDFVLRPWVVAVSHFGLFARDENSKQNFKTTVTVNFLHRLLENGQVSIRKTVTFYEAAPLSVGSYETAYGKNTGVRFAKTTWTYTNYSVN